MHPEFGQHIAVGFVMSYIDYIADVFAIVNYFVGL
jgi:hypothetical protein